MNILFTSVGRRSYLIRYFKQALEGKGLVICANSVETAPALSEADLIYKVSQSTDVGYFDEIKAICLKHDIKAIFSLHDLDNYVLSQFVKDFETMGIVPFLPNLEWANIALDKLLTSTELMRSEFTIPWTEVNLDSAKIVIEKKTNERSRFPVILKARYGFGSLGLRVCKDPNELEILYAEALDEIEKSAFFPFINQIKPNEPLLVIQEMIDGTEVCIDIVNDLSGNFLTCFATTIHAMRAGESDSATTMAITKEIHGFARKFSELSKHIGIWGVDCIYKDGTFFPIDINTRFTGDYPFNHIAGANIPKAFISLLEGRPVDNEWLKSSSGVRGFKDIVPTTFNART